MAAGADPSEQNDAGISPLHQAVYAERPDIVIVMLCAGADPHLVNKRGETPLDIASKPSSIIEKQKEIIALLEMAA